VPETRAPAKRGVIGELPRSGPKLGPVDLSE